MAKLVCFYRGNKKMRKQYGTGMLSVGLGSDVLEVGLTGCVVTFRTSFAFADILNVSAVQICCIFLNWALLRFAQFLENNMGYEVFNKPPQWTFFQVRSVHAGAPGQPFLAVASGEINERTTLSLLLGRRVRFLAPHVLLFQPLLSSSYVHTQKKLTKKGARCLRFMVYHSVKDLRSSCVPFFCVLSFTL